MMPGMVKCRGFTYCRFSTGNPDGWIRASTYDLSPPPHGIIHVQPAVMGNPWRCASVDPTTDYERFDDDPLLRGYVNADAEDCESCTDL